MRMIRLMYVAPEKEDEGEGGFSLRNDGYASTTRVAVIMTHMLSLLWHSLDDAGREVLRKEALSEEFVDRLKKNEAPGEEVKADAE